MRPKNDYSAAIILGLFVLLIYCSNFSALGHGDPTANVFTALNLAKHAEPFLNRVVRSETEAKRFHLVSNKDGNIASPYGLGPALLASPIFLAADMWNGQWDLQRAHMTGKIAASIIAASTAAFLFLTLRNLSCRATAIPMTLLYAFGTPAWSTLSQALWQQTAACCFLAIGLWMAFSHHLTPSRSFLSGAAVGLAIFCRPSHAATLVALSLCFRRRELGAFVLGSLPPLFATVLWNRVAYGGLFTTGQALAGQATAYDYTGSFDLWSSPLIGALGLLFSPSRGLIFFCPFLFAAFIGFRYARVSSDTVVCRASMALAAMCLATFAIVSCWFGWWGGWSYGPRLLADAMLPAVILTAVGWQHVKGSKLRTLFVATSVWSAFVQGLGAYGSDFVEWNCGTPNLPKQDVDHHHERL